MIIILFQGIKFTLDSMPDNGVILVFMEEKNVKIFFAIYSDRYGSSSSLNATSPYYSSTAASLEVYKRLSKGKMFYTSQDLARYGTLDLDSEKFFDAVVHRVRNKL